MLILDDFSENQTANNAVELKQLEAMFLLICNQAWS